MSGHHRRWCSHLDNGHDGPCRRVVYRDQLDSGVEISLHAISGPTRDDDALHLVTLNNGHTFVTVIDGVLVASVVTALLAGSMVLRTGEPLPIPHKLLATATVDETGFDFHVEAQGVVDQCDDPKCSCKQTAVPDDVSALVQAVVPATREPYCSGCVAERNDLSPVAHTCGRQL